MFIDKKCLIIFILGVFTLSIASESMAAKSSEKSTQRPTYTMRRIEGTSDVIISFTNNMVNLNSFHLSESWPVREILIGRNTGGIASNVIEQTIPSRCYYDHNISSYSSACDDFKFLIGKPYKIDISRYEKHLPEGESVCLVPIAVLYDQNRTYDYWQQDCIYIPPPDCTGDDCDGTTNPPEEKLSCSVKSTAINLAYGSMPMGSANGKTASGEVNIDCNKAGAKISFSLKSGGDTISLSNGMKTKLTVDGKGIGSTITGVKGSNRLKVIGTLSGNEVEGGFSGSGVLVADYQ